MKNMVKVAEAEQIVLAQAKSHGNELLPFESAQGRIIAEALVADRDLPPCNRVTMDGIAMRFTDWEHGTREFRIKGVVAAGDIPIEIDTDECVEIMTGAALPDTADTVIRYEDLLIKDGSATVLAEGIRRSQNIHKKGKDKKKGDEVAAANQLVDSTLTSMAASVGAHTLSVQKLPRTVIISTGDELVDVTAHPTPYQVRRSNSYTIAAILKEHGIYADMLHLPDEPVALEEKLKRCVQEYDVILLGGGVSMGKYDHVPAALEALNVEQLFHKVQQRPGKPFWFGRHSNGTLVFAFPGNPVSTFMCMHRYFVPWLQASLNIAIAPKYAILDADINFTPALQYFVQVRMQVSNRGHLLATPTEGNGSGDFANLLGSDAFMELPLEQSNFIRGEVYRIWPFKQIV